MEWEINSSRFLNIKFSQDIKNTTQSTYVYFMPILQFPLKSCLLESSNLFWSSNLHPFILQNTYITQFQIQSNAYCRIGVLKSISKESEDVDGNSESIHLYGKVLVPRFLCNFNRFNPIIGLKLCRNWCIYNFQVHYFLA